MQHESLAYPKYIFYTYTVLILFSLATQRLNIQD